MSQERAKNYSKRSNGCFHSKYLNNVFNISNRGVDYYNNHNIGFEFKESFMENRDNIFYKVPEHQAKVSDYFVFCVDTSEYYLVNAKVILYNFGFKTKQKNANIRINTIRKVAVFLTLDVLELKDYIDKITVRFLQ